MLKRILVPLDGSERAERALPVAARLARSSGGALTLLQVLNAPAELLPYVVPGFEPSTLGADLEGATNYLASLAALPQVADVPTEPEVHTGLAPSMVLAIARSKGADLIVLSSHDRNGLQGGLQRWGLGGVAQKVARHAEAPVLVLREDDTDSAEALAAGSGGGTGQQPVAVLVALDGSPAAEAALAPAVEVARALAAPGPAELHLLHVLPAEAATRDPERARQWAEGYLQQTAQALRAGSPAGQPPAGQPPLTVEWSLARDADVAHALGQAVQEQGCALVALTTHGQSGLQAWVTGSIAERMLDHAPAALLVVHPPVTSSPQR